MSDFDVLRFAADNAGMNIFDALIKAYKQGSLDTIDDAIHHLDNSRVNCHEDYVDGIDFAIGVLGQLKEKKE